MEIDGWDIASPTTAGCAGPPCRQISSRTGRSTMARRWHSAGPLTRRRAGDPVSEEQGTDDGCVLATEATARQASLSWSTADTWPTRPLGGLVLADEGGEASDLPPYHERRSDSGRRSSPPTDVAETQSRIEPVCPNRWRIAAAA